MWDNVKVVYLGTTATVLNNVNDFMKKINPGNSINLISAKLNLCYALTIARFVTMNPSTAQWFYSCPGLGVFFF